MAAMAGSEAAPRVLHLAPGTPLGGGIVAYSTLFRESLRMAGVAVETLEVPFTRVNDIRGTGRYVREALARARDYDLVHAELGGGSLREFYAAGALGRRGDVPLCVTVHDAPRPVWWPFNFAPIRDVLVARRLVAIGLDRPALRIERAVLAAADAIFTLSSRGADAVATCFPGLPAAEVLPYPIPPAPPANGATPASAGRSGLVVGFYGHWYAGKGIETLLDALATAQTQQLDIRARIWGVPLPGSGRTGSGYRRSVDRRLRRLRLDRVADIPGHLPAAAVLQGLRSCDAVVLPYRNAPRLPQLASTSAALHEVLAGGVPVVASDVRALRETLSHERTGLLVPPEDPEALLSALRRLHDDPALRATLRRGAEEHARGLDAARAGQVARRRYEALLL
jgi:glycosyltransferase involved in cell wall biosynthesis